MNRKVLNATIIKFKNTISSPAIKVTLALAVIFSILLSFFPYFESTFFKGDGIVVVSNVDLGSMQDSNIVIKKDHPKNYDVKVDYANNVYNVEIKTKLGYENIGSVIDRIKQLNLVKYVVSKQLTESERNQLSNNNIITKIDDGISQVKESMLNFFMMMSMIFYIIMMLLISRIGAQVAFEKGNKVTEIILTSITRKQLFFCQVVSSVFVVIISFAAVSAPMIVAYIVNDLKIVSDFSFLTAPKIILFLMHLTTVSICLVIFAIGISSMAKQAEDANTLSALSLLPLLISYIYFIFAHDIYRGGWGVLNYIPLVSAFPVFGAILGNLISNKNVIIICLFNIVFLALTYLVSRKIYCKKISNI